jgi:hypothetical protein
LVGTHRGACLVADDKGRDESGMSSGPAGTFAQCH